MEFTFASVYLVAETKILMLSKTIAKLDNLKFFMQLAWESKLMTTEQYSIISTELEGIGQQLGAWRKGLLKEKTPANK